MTRANKPVWVLQLWLLCCALWFSGAAWAQEAKEVPVPVLTARVTDLTHTLSESTISSLESQLTALELRKGAQLVVLMVPTTGPDTIEQFATRVFDKWKLGRQKVDDGILFLIAKDDRTLRFEVGYGLEGAVPDVKAGRIINEFVVPHFRDGDFSAGVVAGVEAVTKLIDGEDLPRPEMPVNGNYHEESSWGFSDLFDGGLLLLGVLVALPPVVSALVAGAVIGWYSSSVLIALVAALGFGLVSWFLGITGLKAAIMNSRGGGGGGGGGRGGGGWGGGGGGSSGGGFSGGGGSSGGGGASGRW